jgi:hypothetical protein
VAEAVSRQFCRVLIPSSDQSAMPRPEDANLARLTGTVEAVAGGLARIRLTGTFEAVHLVEGDAKRPLRGAATAEGIAVYDLKQQVIQSVLIVFSGSYGRPNEEALNAAGAVVEWYIKAPGKPAKTTPAYPLKKSGNGRYLVDQNSVPFLIAGDSPQALMVNLTEAESDMYFANRKSHGFNAVWINLLCKPGTGGRKDGSTHDGTRPFKTADDLSTPNEAYFDRCDRMIHLAAKYDLLVFLDPSETIDHLKMMLQNGPTKCRAYGQYLGNRYKNSDNIIWLHGNDFGNWRDAKSDEVVMAVALGIKDKAPRHLHTVELYGRMTSSLDDPKWEPIIGLNAAYPFFCTYPSVLKDYNRPISFLLS